MSRRLAPLLIAALALAGFTAWQLSSVQPARSRQFLAWQAAGGWPPDRGAALFAFGDFGALDLDTLKESATPWPVLSAALALNATGGQPDKVEQAHVTAALKRYGFLFPTRAVGMTLPGDVPLGLSLGSIERVVPPLRVSAVSIGCPACHAGPLYRADGTPDPRVAVLGRPNTAINLEAFAGEGYAALQAAFADQPSLKAAIRKLFPGMTLRERLTLDWIVLPKAKARLAELAKGMDKPFPFSNGRPGLTNGIGALKDQLGVTPHHSFNPETGFVSVPDLANRTYRSAFLADGAYAPKSTGAARFRAITREEAAKRDPRAIAALASFFLVPSMGLSPPRAAAAIPELTEVVGWLAGTRPMRFPGDIDKQKAAAGRTVYTRACAACHGTYDDSLDAPVLLSFPNWAGDVGTDRSRVIAFDAKLKAAIDTTPHGRKYIDADVTGKVAAPLLSGLWSSAPYFVNGSVPTLRHLLEPETRPLRFMTGGHRLNFALVGVDGVLSPDGTWSTPPGYVPYATPALIDTTAPGFSNRGHEAEVRGLTPDERTDLLEYLKLL